MSRISTSKSEAPFENLCLKSCLRFRQEFLASPSQRSGLAPSESSGGAYSQPHSADFISVALCSLTIPHRSCLCYSYTTIASMVFHAGQGLPLPNRVKLCYRLLSYIVCCSGFSQFSQFPFLQHQWSCHGAHTDRIVLKSQAFLLEHYELGSRQVYNHVRKQCLWKPKSPSTLVRQVMLEPYKKQSCLKTTPLWLAGVISYYNIPELASRQHLMHSRVHSPEGQEQSSVTLLPLSSQALATLTNSPWQLQNHVAMNITGEKQTHNVLEQKHLLLT